jgi:hypothetical protein
MSAVNVNGVQCQKIADGSQPSVTQVGGRVRCFIETYTYNSEATGSTITVAQLPAGAQIVGMTYSSSVTLGGTATLAVGDGTTSGAYVTAAAYTAVGDTPLVVKEAGAGVASPLTAPGKVVLTTAAAALPSSGTLLFKTYYVVD